MSLSSSPASAQVSWRAYLTLGLLGLVWGTSFILIKKGLVVFAPVQVACLRMGFSALAFVPLLMFNLHRMDWSRVPYLIIVGLTSSAIPAILFATAQTRINSSTAGMLNSLTPLFTLLLGMWWFRAKASFRQGLGVLLGLSGAIFLIWLGPSKAVGSSQNSYAGLVVLASLCYAIGTNIIGRKLVGIPSLVISSASFGLVGAPMLGALLLSPDFWRRVQEHPQALPTLGYLLILAMVGTVISTIIFFKLIQDTSPVFGSTVAYLMPVVALFWGLLDGETIVLAQGVGLALILSGVYLSRQ